MNRTAPGDKPEAMQEVLENFDLREARADKITCLVWLGVIIATYSFFIFSFRDTVTPQLVSNITKLVMVMVPAFSLIA